MNVFPFRKLKNIPFYSTALTVAILAVIFISLYFFCKTFLEPKAYDLLIRLTANQKPSENIVNVTIDDESISKIGRWPWKRTNYADIFDYLENNGKAASITFDALIASYGEENDDKEFFNRVKKSDKLIIGLLFNKKSVSDPILEKVLKNNFALPIEDSRNKKTVKHSEYGSISYIPVEFLSGVKYAGSVLSKPDKDGVIRKLEPFFLFKNNYYPSLGLATYSKIKGDNSFKIDNNYIYNSHINLSKIPIINVGGSFTYLKWYKYPHKSYSAWKVLKSYEQIKKGQKPLLDPEIFRNKIVFVGATASALYDEKVTPMGVDYPGVDIQATFADNLLNGEFMHKSSLSTSLSILLATILITLAIVLTVSPLQSLIMLVLLMLVYFNYCLWSYSNNQAIDIITPQVFLLFSIAIGYMFKFLLEGKRKEKLKLVMGKYLSKDVMENIMKDIDRIDEPGGERTEVTVLFSDIRNFTAISETLEPEEVSSILCEYFSEMVPIINKYNGTLNKFVGDAILAIFNAPIKDEHHPRNAVFCAVDMIEKVDELQKKWITEGKPKIEIGIGINTGEVFVGSIGSKDRLEYTVIGDTVNVANRIEAQNRFFGTRLLISLNTYERVKKLVDVIRISSVSIRGKADNIDIYEILSVQKT